MRIIAGRYRHRTLESNPGNTTRPITDRAKVRLFDRLQMVVPGKRVADIFSGTGSLGIEALSRGALSAVMIEQDHRAFELLLANSRKLKLDPTQALCWRVDVFRCSLLPKGTGTWAPYDLVFLDPPYVMADGMKPGTGLFRVLQRLGRPEITTVDSLVVFRTAAEASFVLPNCWEIDDVIHVGSMDLHLIRRSSHPGEEANGDDADSEFDSVDEDQADSAAGEA